nr:MAG TPA: Esterase.3A [Caudoviricetes sp.]
MNRIRATVFIIFINTSFLLNATLYAENTFNFTSLPVSEEESAILVLAPGMNTDGTFFLKESPWMDFAKRNNLGVIALNYSSLAEDLLENRKGYYWPEQGSGQALLDEIKRVYGKDLPIILYGFSGGAQFVSRFVDWCPDRIIAWCAYSAQFWDYPKDGSKITKARGIVACGDQDGLRWQPSFGFYYQGRKNKRPWIWVNISNTGHNRSAKFEKFVRQFFDEELAIWRGDKKPTEDVYSDISNSDNELLLLSEQPELQCPFRTKELLESWKKIQAP